MMVNSGYVTNEGLEISGKFHILQNTPLKWNIDANISFIKNQIGGLEEDQFATRLWYNASLLYTSYKGYIANRKRGFFVFPDGYIESLNRCGLFLHSRRADRHMTVSYTHLSSVGRTCSRCKFSLNDMSSASSSVTLLYMVAFMVFAPASKEAR